MSIEATKTIGEIAVEEPNAAKEFEKLGIDYCCGGLRTLGEACAEAKIPLEEALRRLSQGMATPSQTAGREWKNEPLTDLIAHIKDTHHVFVRKECLRIEALAEKVVAKHGSNHPELLQAKDLFRDLSGELATHLVKEEQVLFPYIVRLEEAAAAGEPAPPAMFGTIVNPVRMMMQEHDGAGVVLKQLRAVTKNYVMPEDACTSYRAFYEALLGFEADLHQHIHLENNVLFPRAVPMESGQ
jgi:regulator of cell morphogenesis and NO signaling